MEKMLRRLIGENIELYTVLETALGQVRADPGQIEQVILNLAVNARDAMPGGGRLTIETSNVVLNELQANRHVGVDIGSYVMLTVTDTGCGMDEIVQSHLFEPFFTTKGPGKGTGLGLSTVYGVVTQSGGKIWVSSTPGQGSTFKIYLPRVEEKVGPGPEEAPAMVLTGSETILVVEDEDEVRNLVRRILQKRGYRVLEAASGSEAVAQAQNFDGSIHLLLTDVVMPRMNGADVARTLRLLRPLLPVLYMSGYPDESMVQQGLIEPGAMFIQKPFSPDALARRIREVLDGSRVSGAAHA
jgi:CheY-like chemotaxis protein